MYAVVVDEWHTHPVARGSLVALHTFLRGSWDSNEYQLHLNSFANSHEQISITS
jgi:hypothetical protein